MKIEAFNSNSKMITIDKMANSNTSGSESIVLTASDGNSILIDPHV